MENASIWDLSQKHAKEDVIMTKQKSIEYNIFERFSKQISGNLQSELITHNHFSTSLGSIIIVSSSYR